jgi:hypothetical protein
VGIARWVAPIAGIAATLFVTRAATGDGAPCASSTAGWVVNRGSLAPGLACGSAVGATDAWSGPFSRCEFVREQPVSVPFAMEVTWQRLGPDGNMSLGLFVRGGILLLKQGAYGFYHYSESDFQWRDLPGFSPYRESTMKVEQREQDIALWIDGRRAFVIPFAAPRSPGLVGLGLKGERGHRSRMRFHGFSLTPLR